MKVIKKSYTRKSILEKRDKTFKARLNDLKEIFKGLLEKAGTKISPSVRHTKRRDGKPLK